MAKMIDRVLETYLRAYRGLIAVEPIDENNVTISFPFHLAANHRVELTVTYVGNKKYVISDGARTLGEIHDAGYSLTKQTKERLERFAGLSGLRIVNDHLVLDSSYAELGTSIQRFLEVSKTIGDVYLVHKQRADAGDELITQVRTVLDSERILYRPHEKIWGALESHPFDLVAPPNGHPGLAVSVLSGQNTHTVAQIWYYKCDDIRRVKQNNNIKLGLVYDIRFEPWSDASKEILRSKADVVLPGDSLQELAAQLQSQGVLGSKSIKSKRPRG
jgi:hypothetical protein